MKVLFAGTPGVRKATVLTNLRQHLEHELAERVYAPKQGEVPIIDHRLYGKGQSTAGFLQQAEEEQRKRWSATFAQIRDEFSRHADEHHFLGLHFIYHFKRLCSSAVDFRALVDWSPDCIVTLIDDAYCMRARIHTEGYHAFDLSELLVWRSEELLIGDLLSRTIDPGRIVPHYLVAVKHPVSMLAKLLLKPHAKRVYLSYNITGARDAPERRRINEDFRAAAHAQSELVAFDPLTIDERSPASMVIPVTETDEPDKDKRAAAEELRLSKLTQYTRNGKFLYDGGNYDHRWVIPSQGILAGDDDLRYPVEIPITELEGVAKALDMQITTRDFRLVHQGETLVVYRPTIYGGSISSGVDAEIKRARAENKRVIVYLKRGTDTLPALKDSPFKQLDPTDDPDIVYEETEQRFWARLQELGNSAVEP